MGLFTAWFNEAEPETQGSHCDTGSHNTYQVGNLTDAVEAETAANERGDRVEWMDAPVDARDTYNVEPGQQFTMSRTEEDHQGVNHEPRQAPGR